MLLHSRFWWIVLLIVVFLLLATAVGAKEPTPAPSPAASAPVSPPAEDGAAGPRPGLLLLTNLLLHVVATVVGLRIGMKVFYESAMFGGFCGIVAIDAAVVAGMHLAGPLCSGFSALLGPQVVVTALVMVVTLHHFGFTKDRMTVIPAVLMAKAVGFFAEVVLRMLFLEAMVRYLGRAG